MELSQWYKGGILVSDIFFFEMISLFIMMLKSLIIKHDRFYKFHVVDGGALILIFLVFLQKFRAALHI